MVTETDMKKMIERWKRGTRALRIYDQRYGHHVVRLLERYNGPSLKLFDDYLEAATFVLFVGMLRDMENRDIDLDDEKRKEV
jgi:hypothetical protein